MFNRKKIVAADESANKSPEKVSDTSVSQKPQIVVVRRESHSGTLFLVLIVTAALAATGLAINHRQDTQQDEIARVARLQNTVNQLQLRLAAAEDSQRLAENRVSELNDRLSQLENRTDNTRAAKPTPTKTEHPGRRARLETTASTQWPTRP